MAFNIQLADAAERDIALIVEHIAEDSPVSAQKWFDDIFCAFETLCELPHGHALIPEVHALKRDLRAMHHHSHRVIYEIHDVSNIVYIARVYHSARLPLSLKDIL